MFGTVNMYPLAQVPYDPTRSGKQARRGDARRSAASCNSLVQSESSSRLVRHASSRSVASSRPFTSVDLFKALELIEFVGCETHHQLIAALRMLIPLIDTEQRTTQIERHRGHSMPSPTADEGTCSTLPHPSYHLQVDRVLNTVVEMYTERKLSSRAKKKKDSEQGRLEVGQKLGMVEDLFLEQPIILRAFDVVRLRFNLPPRTRTLKMDAPDLRHLGSKPVNRSFSPISLSLRTSNQRAADGEDIKAQHRGDEPFCKSSDISRGSIQNYDQPPPMRPRESISSFETENFVADEGTKADTPFQLFWGDGNRLHATSQQRAVNYSLPKSSWQPVPRLRKNSITTETHPGAADGGLRKALESFSFRSVKPSSAPAPAPSTPVLSELRPELDSTSSWELAAFESDSQSRTVKPESKAQSADADHVQQYPAVQDTTAVNPSPYTIRPRSKCKESFSAVTGLSHDPEEDQSPNGLQRSMRRELPLDDLWSYEVLLRTAQRERAGHGRP